MKLGVFTVLLQDRPLDDALAYLKDLGVEMVEIGCGGFPGKAHCDPEVLLKDDMALEQFKKTVDKYGMEISALSCHGNPVHPNKAIAEKYLSDLKNAILLAEKLGIGIVNTFSGCPGDCPESQHPNWVTCPWPDDYSEVLKYQWDEVLIPFWRDFVKFASSHNVNKIAFELHPGFCVYNVESMLKIREAVGENLGANLDSSHLVWQGVDMPAVIRKLGKAIYHFHAKDTRIDSINTSVNGVLDTKPYSDEINRSWIFRSVGYGSDYQFWKDIMSNLRMVGYDYAISIEHEDSLMKNSEGLEKACRFLQEVIIREPMGEMWWA